MIASVTVSPHQGFPAMAHSGAARSVSLGRLGEPREFGWLAALVASPLGRSLSGSTITLEGAAADWWGRWPPAALAGESWAVPTEERGSS